MLDYRPRYYLTHPWEVFSELYLELKWAWQRVFRGWDDRVIWSLDYYLCEHLPQWLRMLKEDKQGCPVEMFSDPYKTEYSDEEFDEAKKRWDDLLEEMAQGFEAGKDYIENNFPAWKLFHDEDRKRFGHEKGYDNSVDYFIKSLNDPRRKDLKKELDHWKNLETQREEAHNKFNRALDLLRGYFFSLWT
jgi:hypothetical protein